MSGTVLEKLRRPPPGKRDVLENGDAHLYGLSLVSRVRKVTIVGHTNLHVPCQVFFSCKTFRTRLIKYTWISARRPYLATS